MKTLDHVRLNLFPKKFPLEESNHFKLKSLLNQIESSNNMAAVHFLKFFMGSGKFGDQEAEKELGERIFRLRRMLIAD